MYKVNMGQTKGNMQALKTEYAETFSDILKKATVAYSKKGQSYIPPNMGQNRIQKRFYTRPIYFLPSEVRRAGNKQKEQDIQALKDGMKYKVLAKKHNKKVVWYYKSYRKAKSASRIRTRGLFRSMMGLAIDTIGEIVPAVFRSLASKSKALMSLKFLNVFTLNKSDDVSKIKVENKVTQAERFQQIVNRQGEYQAGKVIKRSLRKIANERKKV